MRHPAAGHSENETTASIPASARAAAPDLARGFMLLFIALANVGLYLWGREVFSVLSHVSDGNALDRGLSAAVVILVDQRTYPMFAFLFGYGMVQFAQSRISQGVPESEVRRLLRRRNLWLIPFGAVHATLLFWGDILGTYGLMGLILVAIFWRRSDRALKITAIVFTTLTALVAVVMLVSALIVQTLPADTLETFDVSGNSATGDIMSGEPNFFLAAALRLGMWVIATPVGALSPIVPAILLGMLAARRRWLEVPALRPRLGLVAFWGILFGIAGAVPTALIYLGALPAFDSVPWAFVGVLLLSGLAGGLGYAALFGLIGLRLQGRLPWPLRAVAAVGKRSLTFYLLQSVLFAPVLSAWGLGLGATMSQSAMYGLALGVWLLSLVLAWLMERRDARGPAEVLLRKLMVGRGGGPTHQ